MLSLKKMIFLYLNSLHFLQASAGRNDMESTFKDNNKGAPTEMAPIAEESSVLKIC